MAKSLRERFESKFIRAGPDDCWPWTGAMDGKGYGRLYVDGRLALATHVAWRLAHGEMPHWNECVCHSCDAPECVNPHHLFLGTRAENDEDRDRKGRGARGERVGTSKLTRGQVEEIRRRYVAGGVSQQRLADEFGVSQVMVSKIVRREQWRHVPLARTAV